MMLAGFLFLLPLTGGSTSNFTELLELLDDHQSSNQSFEESGSTSNFTELLELLDDQKNSNQSSEEIYRDSSKGNCGYQDVLNHLNLTKNNDLYTMARPVKNYTSTTNVHLQMLFYGILDVKEIDQAFVPYVWIFMSWENEHISWHPRDFCGLDRVIVPTYVLWKPDLAIEEILHHTVDYADLCFMVLLTISYVKFHLKHKAFAIMCVCLFSYRTEMDKAPPSPYLYISFSGRVSIVNDMMLASTCKMHIYKFPFDIQSCDLSFKSAIYPGLTNKTVDNFGFKQSVIVYTVTMKRRSVFYIVNFLLPILFFLCLDLASFLISDRGGEKLSFKVTVLLAVTVMQLILNEILPSSSDKIPLIVAYCIGIFGLMMLSLLETILVMYLMEKDLASQDNEADKDQSLSEDCNKQGKVNFHKCFRDEKKWTHCVSVCDGSADETPSELLSSAIEGSSSKLTESHALEKVSDDLREVEKTLTALLNSRKEEWKPGYWTKVAKRINKVFSIIYVTGVSLFLVFIFLTWNYTADK
ncbi:5-hydroxytryptamine receptor 3A-like [Siniperca chuatsi]|uniref:5-hydroxytryptamine receptor 3A-like n=1 Tax=Siniperca chuatsi TaxID=119488 RepID=UPI001CE1223F|nr:5-hydroxytryptamine receptor 3A-like [Siniperca chuatsi]